MANLARYLAGVAGVRRNPGRVRPPDVQHAGRATSSRPHIDEGFDLLGHTIRRQRQRGRQKRYVYTYPSRKAIQSIKDRVSVKTYRNTRNQDLDELITTLNETLRGWANYFRHGVSKATFNAVDHHAWNRLMRWIRRKYGGRHRLTMPNSAAASATSDGSSPTTGACSPAHPA
jgi:hypothetical protein